MTALQIVGLTVYLAGAVTTCLLSWRLLFSDTLGDPRLLLDGLGLSLTVAVLWPAFVGVGVLSVVFYGVGSLVKAGAR